MSEEDSNDAIVSALNTNINFMDQDKFKAPRQNEIQDENTIRNSKDCRCP